MEQTQPVRRSKGTFGRPLLSDRLKNADQAGATFTGQNAEGLANKSETRIMRATLAIRGDGMKIGITGHQERQGLDWPWVDDAVRRVVRDAGPGVEGLSCLAIGADQHFAQTVLDEGCRHTAVIPFAGYELEFEDGDPRTAYFQLLSRSTVVNLDLQQDREAAFMEASKFVVGNCDQMIAVWDEKPAQGSGGTADVVQYVRTVGLPVIVLNPFSKTVTRID
jgi:hypothetical protein